MDRGRRRQAHAMLTSWFASTSAPLASSASTTSKWPLEEAAWSGVHPRWGAAAQASIAVSASLRHPPDPLQPARTSTPHVALRPGPCLPSFTHLSPAPVSRKSMHSRHCLVHPPSSQQTDYVHARRGARDSGRARATICCRLLCRSKPAVPLSTHCSSCPSTRQGSLCPLPPAVSPHPHHISSEAGVQLYTLSHACTNFNARTLSLTLPIRTFTHKHTHAFYGYAHLRTHTHPRSISPSCFINTHPTPLSAPELADDRTHSGSPRTCNATACGHT
jgi:hypothetical protein